jgi:hypothetical protein
MALPFLPGNSFNPNLGRDKFHKPQQFDYVNDAPMNTGDDKKYKPNHSNIPRGSGAMAPSWVAFDKQVLRFDGYYKEAVVERASENYRVHLVRLFFYLEDDTIQIVANTTPNSGIPQGTILRRSRVNRAAPQDASYYTVEDLNVGVELEIYGKVFKLCDCDQFTRNFLRKLGVRVGEPCEDVPKDPYTQHRSAEQEAMQPLRPYERIDKLGQYLEHSGHVLRFYLLWDDTAELCGDLREFVLHYFLQDDDIEVKEVIPENAGRDTVPIFLNKSKLPKSVGGMPLPGKRADRTVLNVFGPMGRGGRYILDSLKSGALDQQFYTDADLSVGSLINIWGRKMLICDCDEFTRQYYKTKYGTIFEPMKVDRPSFPAPPREVPIYNGFGSYEDSLGNCDSLIPKPPRKDFMKFMEKDRNGLESNILRFAAVLTNKNKLDRDRRFIVSYFLSDDTMSVFEPLRHNSGVTPGKFMERARQEKPGQPKHDSRTPDFFVSTDLFVGSTLVIQDFPFFLVDADEYTYSYMEKHADYWPQANIDLVLYKLKGVIGSASAAQLKGSFSNVDNQGTVSYENFRQSMMAVTGSMMTEAEIITLARYYGGKPEDDIPLDVLRSSVQESLRRANFENFNDLRKALMLRDPEKTGFLHAADVRKTALAMHINIQNDLLSHFIARLGAPTGQVDYSRFLNEINWRDNPGCIPSSTTVPIRFDAQWTGTSDKDTLKKVSLTTLVNDLF